MNRPRYFPIHLVLRRLTVELGKECSTCGVLVTDQPSHDRWHARVDRR